MRIVNVRGRTPDDFGPNFFYCGRASGGWYPSALANPYVIGKHGTRDEVIAKYRKWLWAIFEDALHPETSVDDESTTASSAEIVTDWFGAMNENSVLGCWCDTTEDAESCTTCHCGVIARAWRWLQTQK